MPLRDRSRTPDIQDSVPLQPGAIPGSTFIRPPAQNPAGDPLISIGKSLGQLVPGLWTLGQQVQAQQDQEDKKQLATLPLMSNKDVSDAYAAGKLPGMDAPDSITDIASRKMAGERSALGAQEAMRSDLASGKFDWERGNIDDFIAQGMKAGATSLGEDHYAIQGFTDQMKGFRERAMAMRTQQATALDQSRRQDNTYEGISLAIDAAKARGDTPEQIASAARTAVVSLAGPKGSQQVSLGDADRYVLQKVSTMVAEAKTPEDLKTATALMTAPRMDLDGVTRLPPLKNTASHAAQVGSIAQQVAAKGDAFAEQAGRQIVQTADVEMLNKETGKLATLDDITLTKPGGGTFTIKGNEPRRVSRRPFGLGQAAKGWTSVWAK